MATTRERRSKYANQLSLTALSNTTGLSVDELQIHQATVGRNKHRDLLSPALIQHASKTISDKMLLGANAAMDAFLDKAQAGELAEQEPGRLIKMASVALEAGGAYAAFSGAKDVLNNTLQEYGVINSHSASRITVEQKITVESQQGTPQPVDITPNP